MVITYHGGACIKISAGDTTLVFSPASKESKNVKPTNFGADTAFISLNHPDTNGSKQVARGDKEPFVIFGPGEYEVGPITAKGMTSSSEYGDSQGFNTIYSVIFDGLNILYLGMLGDENLKNDVLEEIETVDVLFVPIGGDGVIGPARAQKLAVKLEAKIVVPIWYGSVGKKDALEQFLKEAGAEDVKPTDKLTIKPKDVIGKSGEVVVLGA